MTADDTDANSMFDSLIEQWSSEEHGTINKTVDFRKPLLRQSMKYVFPLFTFLYAVVGAVGVIGNMAIIVIFAWRRLHRDQTYFLMMNLAFSDVLKSAIVLPISLANLVIENWLFGSFMCFFLPMMQFFPVHASTLTMLVIAVDRYRVIVKPFKARVPAGLCIIAVWIVAVCVVLPYVVYLRYIDLGAFLGEQFDGVGMCYINHERNIEEYIRAMFVTLYALPLAIIAFLYVKVSAEIKQKETNSVNLHITSHSYQNRVSVSESFSRTTAPEAAIAESRVDSDGPSCESAFEKSEAPGGYYDDDLDVKKEKVTQSYLITMVTLFALCWFPLNNLILVTYFVHENSENRSHYDLTFLTFTWFGFLSTCVNPILIASWRMSNTTKERLRGYLRFTNRGRT